jgi:HlyD family secretion protein
MSLQTNSTKQDSLVKIQTSNSEVDNDYVTQTNNTNSTQQTLLKPQEEETTTDEENSSQGTIEEQPQQEEENSESEKSQESSKRASFKKAFKKYWWLVPVLGIVLAIGGVTVMRLRDNTSQETTASQTTPLSVRIATAQREPIRAWVSSEGRVRAVEYQHLTFEVEGDITYLANRNGRRLREGDRVSEGELLAKVDDRELVADLTQAQAAVAEAQQQRATAAAEVAAQQAQVAQARSSVQQAQAQLAQIRTNRNLAQTQLRRYQFLFEQGAVPATELDTRVSTLQEATANVQAAQAQVTTAQAQVEAAQAQLRAAQERLNATESGITTAQARVTQAEVALEGARIYAPFDGIIAYLNYTEGEYFTPQIVTSQLAGNYQGILERIPMVIIDPSLYEVIVDLAGPTGEQINISQEAFIAPDTDIVDPSVGDTYNETLVASARARGEVFSVNPAISPGGRAIEARIRLNPETTEDVRHGERVLTWIAVEENLKALVVPINAVVYRDQVPYVFVVNEAGVVEQRQVELGIRGITRQEIESGVEVGERVVAQGQNRLVDGASVQVVNSGNEVR